MTHWDNLRKRSEDRLQKSIDEYSREQNAMCLCGHPLDEHADSFDRACVYLMSRNEYGDEHYCDCLEFTPKFTAQNKKEGEE